MDDILELSIIEVSTIAVIFLDVAADASRLNRARLHDVSTIAIIFLTLQMTRVRYMVEALRPSQPSPLSF